MNYSHYRKTGLLFAAAATCNKTLLMRLIKERVSLEAGNQNGHTPLMVAARNGCTECVRLILDYSTDLEVVDKEGNTALIHAATRKSNLIIVELLIERGAYVEHKDIFGRSALMHACVAGDRQMVDVLLTHGADFNSATADEETPLTFATVWNRPDVAQCLLEEGAAVNWHDSHGWTALTYAAYEGNYRLVSLLLAYGADVNIADVYHDTIILKAVRSGNVKCVSAIAKQMTELLTPGPDGRNVLDIALESHNTELVRVLRQELAKRSK